MKKLFNLLSRSGYKRTTSTIQKKIYHCGTIYRHNDSLVAELMAEPGAKRGDRPVQEVRKRVRSTEPLFQDCYATSCCLVRLHKGLTSTITVICGANTHITWRCHCIIHTTRFVGPLHRCLFCHVCGLVLYFRLVLNRG